jgi:methyl-accepting chemotaxis protein
LSSIANVTAIVEQISNKIQKIAENTSDVSVMANKTTSAPKDGNESISKVINQMANIEKTVASSADIVTKLGYRSKEIGQIVDTISSIAEQTNLLALNAAIEAARAGEQGKGFAVVADEIRKLAEQSQGATKKITELINAIQADTNKAVTAINEGTEVVKSGSSLTQVTGDVFNYIETLVIQLTEQVKEIYSVIHKLGESSKEVVLTMNKIDTISNNTVDQTQLASAFIEEQAASTEEVAASSNDLAKLSEKLLNAIGKFKV